MPPSSTSPRPRPGSLDRPRLLERLTLGTARDLTLICAPAGFGKTTLLGEWARRSRRPVAWLSLEAMLTVMVDELLAVPDEVVLVLDDYHLVEAPAVHDSVAVLLERLPPQPRLVVASRADPPLPLARLRAIHLVLRRMLVLPGRCASTGPHGGSRSLNPG